VRKSQPKTVVISLLQELPPVPNAALGNIPVQQVSLKNIQGRSVFFFSIAYDLELQKKMKRKLWK
jgi:hypothetical protein